MSASENTSIVKKSQETKKRKIKKTIAVIEQQEVSLENDETNINYLARSVVQATLPHSDPKDFIYTRKNGNFKLSIKGEPEIGLPYGTIPRLILAWLTTEAVRTKSRELVLGNSLSEFMRAIDLVPTGGRWGSITRLKEQVKRLFSCSISCIYNDGKNWSMRNITPVESANIWWEPTPKEKMKSLFESTVVLTQPFFDEIRKNPIPIRVETLRALKSSAMDLDVYFWLTMLNGRKGTSERLIPYELLQEQFGSGYPKTDIGKKNFKRKFLESLHRVGLVYDAANLLQDDGKFLRYIPGLPDIPK